MKRAIFFLAVIALAFSVQGQKKIQEVKEVNFYGVDFSEARTFGVTETPLQIKTAISNINTLFIYEQDKYDINRLMGKRVGIFYLDDTDDNNKEMDENEMASNTPTNPLSEDKIQAIVNGLSCEKNDKVGLVFIAETLNKPEGMATFHVVFFDEATKEIIYRQKATGAAGGFGIRNYWAKSVYNIMKRWKY